MGSLDGKVAIVTGASRGIGADIARRFGEEGASVAVAARTARPDQSQFAGTIEEVAEEIRKGGSNAIAVPTNLGKPEERERLVAETEAKLGPVDILVSNAAVTFFVPVLDFEPKRYDLMFEVQVKAPFHLAQLVLPGMKERGSGWILNISSRAAIHPTLPPTQRSGRGGTVYGMVKAALERFTTGLAAEVYDDNIAVNVLSPNKVVPTAGTIFHHLTTEGDPNSEPTSVMAEAALALCNVEPTSRTGRIAYSQDLLNEFGIKVPTA